MIFRTASILVAAIFLGGCGIFRGPHHSDAHTLAAWMEGSFSSEEQAASDPDYRDIRLHIARIWRERNDGVWFYVEQAAAGKPPYRQRVYRLTSEVRVVDDHDPGTCLPVKASVYVSAVYLLPGDVHRFDGAWSDPKKFAGVTPSDLSPREGCAVILRREYGDVFYGGTEGKGCASDLAGAKYATSKVRITSDMLESWDQGFNEKDEQVWGATKGPYLFKKQLK